MIINMLLQETCIRKCPNVCQDLLEMRLKALGSPLSCTKRALSIFWEILDNAFGVVKICEKKQPASRKQGDLLSTYYPGLNRGLVIRVRHFST
jgi:hypothetical protein